jgi:hypothetical protein
MIVNGDTIVQVDLRQMPERHSQDISAKCRVSQVSWISHGQGPQRESHRELTGGIQENDSPIADDLAAAAGHKAGEDGEDGEDRGQTALAVVDYCVTLRPSDSDKEEGQGANRGECCKEQSDLEGSRQTASWSDLQAGQGEGDVQGSCAGSVRAGKPRETGDGSGWTGSLSREEAPAKMDGHAERGRACPARALAPLPYGVAGVATGFANSRCWANEQSLRERQIADNGERQNIYPQHLQLSTPRAPFSLSSSSSTVSDSPSISTTHTALDLHLASGQLLRADTDTVAALSALKLRPPPSARQQAEDCEVGKGGEEEFLFSSSLLRGLQGVRTSVPRLYVDMAPNFLPQFPASCALLRAVQALYSLSFFLQDQARESMDHRKSKANELSKTLLVCITTRLPSVPPCVQRSLTLCCSAAAYCTASAAAC